MALSAEAFGPSGKTTVYWLGNAGFLLNSRGTTIMCDPLLVGFDMPTLVESPVRARGVPASGSRIEGQNNLRDHMLERATNFDLAWHQRLWGNDPMPEELRLATTYHVTASVYMTIAWILSGFPTSEEELAELVASMRGIGMEKLFEGARTPGNPYAG